MWHSSVLTLRLPSGPARSEEVLRLLDEELPQCGAGGDGFVCGDTRYPDLLHHGCVTCTALVGAIIRRGKAVVKVMGDLRALLANETILLPFNLG